MTTQQMHSCVTCEPKLDELINDPTIKLLLDRDGIKLDDLYDFLAIARKRHLAKRWQSPSTQSCHS